MFYCMLQHKELDVGCVEAGNCPMVMVLSVKGKSTVAWLYHCCTYCTGESNHRVHIEVEEKYRESVSALFAGACIHHNFALDGR